MLAPFGSKRSPTSIIGHVVAGASSPGRQRLAEGKWLRPGKQARGESEREAMAQLGPPNPATLGELLITFFRRYAREFDFVKSVASVRTGTFLTKTAKGWDKKEAGFKGDRQSQRIETRLAVAYQSHPHRDSISGRFDCRQPRCGSWPRCATTSAVPARPRPR